LEPAPQVLNRTLFRLFFARTAFALSDSDELSTVLMIDQQTFEHWLTLAYSGNANAAAGWNRGYANILARHNCASFTVGFA